MGSDGVHGCGGLVFHVFAKCLRKVGLGNPSVTVGQVAFDKPDPLDATSEKNRRWAAASVRGASASGEFVIDDEMEEEDEEMADAQEISEQVYNGWYRCCTVFSCVVLYVFTNCYSEYLLIYY